MRGKKTAINTAAGLTEELIAVICGFILPRLILSAFGSNYNGLTTSITQFLACAVLLRAGIGGVTRAALYKPLAEHDQSEVNSIIKATDIFMKKIGVILAGAIIVLASIYPILVKNEFEWLFTFSLFIIIGINTFANSFFGITYTILLQADQQLWVTSVMKSICNIINTCLAAVLIMNGFSILIVKIGSALVYLFYPLALSAFVKRKYKIDKNVEPNNKAIAQRWDAYWHQVAVFAMNNTAVIILTFFTNMLEVSVYSIYNLVVNALKRTVLSFSYGLEAAFGNMIAKNSNALLKENVSVMELVLYSISTVVYSSAILLVLQFVSIYTKGIYDVNYIRPSFAYMIFIAQFFNGVRIPYQMVVQAAGHYKQTKKGAIAEPIINLIISIILVIKFGLIGVAVGTLSATLFRTIQYSLYMSKNIVHRNPLIPLLKCAVSFGEGALIILIVKNLQLSTSMSYLSWCINAIITLAVAIVVVIFGAVLFYNKDTNNLMKKIRNAVFKKNTMPVEKKCS